jgi:DNA-binding NarL/FixJ family response regulator
MTADRSPVQVRRPSSKKSVQESLAEAISKNGLQSPPTSWLRSLEPKDADVLSARAQGMRWKAICWRFDISRATAHRRWRRALNLIAKRLNGEPNDE